MTKQFCGQIGQISMQINAVVMGLAGADRIFELIDEQPEEDEGYVTLVNAERDRATGQIIETDKHTVFGLGSTRTTMAPSRTRNCAATFAWTTLTLATRPTTRCCTT